jgi:hypothetical protein
MMPVFKVRLLCRYLSQQSAEQQYQHHPQSYANDPGASFHLGSQQGYDSQQGHSQDYVQGQDHQQVCFGSHLLLVLVM